MQAQFHQADQRTQLTDWVLSIKSWCRNHIREATEIEVQPCNMNREDGFDLSSHENLCYFLREYWQPPPQGLQDAVVHRPRGTALIRASINPKISFLLFDKTSSFFFPSFLASLLLHLLLIPCCLLATPIT